VLETTQKLPFMILYEISKTFPEFNTTGRSFLIMFKCPGEEQKQEPTVCLKECITELTNYLVDEVDDRDLVGLRIRNTDNVQDKVVDISFRRRDQLKSYLVWDKLSKGIQSKSSYCMTDRLEVHLDRVRIPAGSGDEKTKGRSLDVLNAIKKRIVLKAAFLFWLMH